MRRRAACLVLALGAAACTGGADDTQPTSPANTPTTSPQPSATTAASVSTIVSTAEFELDDVWHTAPALPSVEAFDQLAATGTGGQQVVKFSITDFFGEANIEWLDSNFYELHDEWFWFRLLNGTSIAGVGVDPLDADAAPELADIDAAYAWAEQRADRLPLGLRFTSLGRLYSSEFYGLALDDPTDRQLALGSLIRTAATTDQPARWLLELEYRDAPTPAHIERYFDIVTASLAPSIADSVLWVPRSREQEITAEQMAAEQLPFGDRTISFDDLVAPGAVEVYSPGFAAGRLLVVNDAGQYSLGDAGPNDIVVVQRTPDALPPGNGLITGTPQTPLAHVNVLALNRGIPNAFLGGIADNLKLGQLGRVRAPIAIRASVADDGSGMLDVQALTDEEFAEWNSLRAGRRVSVPQPDWTTLPLTIDLDQVATAGPGDLTELALDELRPTIGGKVAGLLGLVAPNRDGNVVDVPDRPLAITVRSYFEHLEPLSATIDAMLRSSTFDRSARARFLVLEGSDDFARTFDSQRDRTFLDGFDADESETVLGEIVAAGGLKQMIRDLPMDAETLGLLDSDLRSQFSDFEPSQGLRFRSSSSVEDIEGFNGAGLYSSNTGYLDPTALPDPDDHNRTVERALKRTWSSYWNVEAVEERRYENVNHVSGGMAVLVHARFDDPLEVSNGVATFTLLPESAGGGAVMALNVQSGDTSVTNPEAGPDDEQAPAPEVVELSVDRAGGTPRIERRAPSTLVDGDGEVLSDDELLDVWRQLNAVTRSWFDRINAGVPAGRQISTLTLDFEFRQMDSAWPADGIDDGGTPRMVIKQARTLEPGVRGLPAEVAELDVPRDVLARATAVDRVRCPSAAGDPDTAVETNERIEIFTDPLAAVDLGFSEVPLVVQVSGNPTRIVDAACTRTSLFTSADAYLADLFANR